MSRRTKIWSLVILTVAGSAGVLSWRAIPQEEAYHNFCDRRALWGIPNFANVISNLGFCVAGAAGLFCVWLSTASKGLKLIYYVVFSGIFLTGLGSGLYHCRPDDGMLVFDRLPMSIVFMGMVAAAMEEGIGPGVGATFLWPLVGAGFISVWWWHHTGSGGAGDLRLYILVQYYPLLLVPAVLLMFSNPRVRRGWRPLLFCFGLYALAKIAETLDCSIYTFLRTVSGHTLKHLIAALATGFLVVRFRIMHASL